MTTPQGSTQSVTDQTSNHIEISLLPQAGCSNVSCSDINREERRRSRYIGYHGVTSAIGSEMRSKVNQGRQDEIILTNPIVVLSSARPRCCGRELAAVSPTHGQSRHFLVRAQRRASHS